MDWNASTNRVEKLWAAFEHALKEKGTHFAKISSADSTSLREIIEQCGFEGDDAELIF